MLRTVQSREITEAVKRLCEETNYSLSDDMKERLLSAEKAEESPLGQKILKDLEENLKIASEDKIPICQDTGMAVVFLRIGQDVHIEGDDLTEAVNKGVSLGYREGYLRKSVVADPIFRKNTGDNTPAVIHTEIVKGDKIEITVAPKGFGSENMSRIFMLKPVEGIEGVKKVILQSVKDAGPNACPPMVVGVGIGGTFEKAAEMAKEALVFDGDEKEWVRDLEKEMLEKINDLGIGPAGLGGRISCFKVSIRTYSTHIAGLPVAVNISCHVNRHKKAVI